MNIRVRQATEDDFKIYKYFLNVTAYHWCYGNQLRLPRKERAEKNSERKVPPRKVKVYENGKTREIISATERNLMYSMEQFKQDINLGHNGASIYVVYDEKTNRPVGTIKWRWMSRKQIQIQEFALLVLYQRKEVVEAALKQLTSAKDIEFHILYADEYGKNIIRGTKLNIIVTSTTKEWLP